MQRLNRVPTRTRSVRSVWMMLTALLVLPAGSLRSQTVTQAALDDVFESLHLEVPELSEMPLRGAGQRIQFKIMPAPSGLTVAATNPVGPVPVQVTVTGWAVRKGTVLQQDGVGYKMVQDDPANYARTIVFNTRAVHWTTDSPISSDPATVEVNIRLSAGAGLGASAIDRTLTTDELAIPRLGIPKVLALFRHPQFAPTRNDVDGYLLVLVPSNSPLNTLNGVKNFLDNLQDAVTNLSWAASFAGSAASIGVLKANITGHPHTQFRIGAKRNLHDIRMINHSFGKDTFASDNSSSLIFLGDNGYRVYLFNNEEYRTNEGWVHFEAGEGTAMVIQVPSLHHKYPPTVPPGHRDVRRASDNGETFGNKISSVRFSEP